MNNGSSSGSSRDHVPEDKDKRLVTTPYGKGTVRRTRRSRRSVDDDDDDDDDDDGRIVTMCEVELSDWTAANEGTAARKPTMLYAPETSLTSVAPTVGCDVVCFAGRGQVIAMGDNVVAMDERESSPCSPATRIEARDQVGHVLPPKKLTIVLSSWRLANRSRVKCYLPSSAAQVVRPKRIYEMDAFEKIEHAFALKDAATKLFQQQQYLPALEEYSRAVGAVKYVQHKNDAPNSLRADLLVVMITCSNNAGTCCVKLGGHHTTERSVEFARQSLDLIEALEKKRGYKIHREMVAAGYTDEKIFGEWKVKAYLIMANGLSARGNVDEALATLKKARAVIADFASATALQRTEREVLKLSATLKERRKAQVSKERRRAQAMFAATTAPAGDGDDESATTATTSVACTKKSAAVRALTNDKKYKKNNNKTPPSRVTHMSPEWFQSPLVLSGLGLVAAGVAGALLVYNQALRKQRV